MTDLEDLSKYLDRLVVPDQLDRPWLLREFLDPLGIEPESDVADLCEDIVLGAAAAGDAVFHMRAGGWRIDVTGTFTRSLLAGSLLGAVLFMHGVTDIPAELFPAILPLVVDVERVKLSRRDKALMIPLRVASQGVEGIALNPQVLYDRLDASIQAQLSFGDFEALCERLIEAGQLDDGGYGEVRARTQPGPAWIRLTWT